MKKLFLFSTALFLMTFALRAQDANAQQEQVKVQVREEAHYAFTEGKLYQVKNQNKVQVRERVVLENGTTINPDGTYQLKNQKQLQLKEGELIDAKGNYYQSQQAFGQQVRTQAQLKNQEYLVVEEGKVYKVQNQEKVQLKEQYKLKNGSTVTPKGELELKNGKKTQLKEGEVIDSEGEKYKSQEKFQNRIQERTQENRMDNDRARMERNQRQIRSERSMRKM